MPQNNLDSRTEDEVRFQCRHIFTAGHRCSSPCLRREEFCYYHHSTRRPVQNPKERIARLSTFELPNLDDRGAIQQAISAVLERIAANQIDPKRAGLLLYGLQIASLNLPKQQPHQKTPPTVSEVVQDPTYGPLAPTCEMYTNEDEMGPAERMLIELNRQFPDHDPVHSIQAETGNSQLETDDSKLDQPVSLSAQNLSALSSFKPNRPKRPTVSLVRRRAGGGFAHNFPNRRSTSTASGTPPDLATKPHTAPTRSALSTPQDARPVPA